MALKYWVRILLMEENRLVKRIYLQSKKEYLMRNRSNWTKTIHKLALKYNFVELWRDEARVMVPPVDQKDKSIEGIKKFWMKQIYQNVQEVEEKEWRIEVEGIPANEM